MPKQKVSPTEVLSLVFSMARIRNSFRSWKIAKRLLSNRLAPFFSTFPLKNEISPVDVQICSMWLQRLHPAPADSLTV